MFFKKKKELKKELTKELTKDQKLTILKSIRANKESSGSEELKEIWDSILLDELESTRNGANSEYTLADALFYKKEQLNVDRFKMVLKEVVAKAKEQEAAINKINADRIDISNMEEDDQIICAIHTEIMEKRAGLRETTMIDDAINSGKADSFPFPDFCKDNQSKILFMEGFYEQGYFRIRNRGREDKYLEDAEYGLTIEKPVFTVERKERDEYIEDLRTVLGERIKWERKSMPFPEDCEYKGVVDVFTGTSESGTQVKPVYVCIYGNKNSGGCPKGFKRHSEQKPASAITKVVQVERMLESGGNFVFIAQNVATIFGVISQNSWGKSLDIWRKCFASAVLDMTAYIENNEISIQSILNQVKSVKRTVGSIDESIVVCELVKKIEMLIFKKESSLPKEEIKKAIDDNEEEILEAIVKILTNPEESNLYSDIARNIAGSIDDSTFRSFIEESAL